MGTTNKIEMLGSPRGPPVHQRAASVESGERNVILPQPPLNQLQTFVIFCAFWRQFMVLVLESKQTLRSLRVLFFKNLCVFVSLRLCVEFRLIVPSPRCVLSRSFAAISAPRP